MSFTTKLLTIAIFCSVAYADSFALEGEASGDFYNDAGTVKYGKSVKELSYAGSAFGPQSSASELSLGQFSLGSSCLLCSGTNYNPFAFQLNIQFFAPVGTDSLVYSGNVKGLTWWVLGGAMVDFDNSPINVAYSNSEGSGSFNLTISDVFLGVGDRVTLKGRVSGGNVSVDESGIDSLVLFAAGLGSLAYFARKRTRQQLS